MIQISTHQTITMENQATLDLRSCSVSVIDSKSNDRVTVDGLTQDAVNREISYFVRSQRYAHNSEAQANARAFLQSLLENCTEGLKYLTEQEATAS
jgi:hypothetical protein